MKWNSLQNFQYFFCGEGDSVKLPTMERRTLTLLCRNFSTFSSRFASNSAVPSDTFRYKDLKIVKATAAQQMAKPKPGTDLKFGNYFADHMFEVDWNVDSGWGQPIINPLHNLSVHPAAKVLHYAIELFEGMKAYRGHDGKIRLFRPEMNVARMRRSAARSALPDFSGEELKKIIEELVRIDQDWIPHDLQSSLYIRPTFIGLDPTLGVGTATQAKLFVITGPAGAYYATGWKPVSLLADPQYVRAFEGGVGSYKMGCNYAPSVMVGRLAVQKGCQQVLWLYGEHEHITEVGTMNVMMYWKNKQGKDELVTAPLAGGIILPGITRDSILTLTRKWNMCEVSERYVGFQEIRDAIKEKRMYEMFGTGTACVVSPVGKILYRPKGSEDFEELIIPTMEHKPNLMQKLYNTILDIQHGKIEGEPGWTTVVA
ncbi:hypothetical protein AB6A40_005008 [Gnathostoma spinigerum]|uniref:branched-chain-amino-acid transaminase n=1 Tax=Gnathostoma spinigerum TaxID=75299 RepID=A0ABD6EE64_9BILA